MIGPLLLIVVILGLTFLGLWLDREPHPLRDKGKP